MILDYDLDLFCMSSPLPQLEHASQLPPPDQRLRGLASKDNQTPEQQTDFTKTAEAPEPVEQPVAPPEQPISESSTEFDQTRESLTRPLSKEAGFIDETIAKLKNVLRGKKPKSTVIPQIKDEATIQIEHIMEEGLADTYQELTIIQQQEFKIKGEATAWQIRNLLKEAHVKIKKIFRLLVEWLQLLPGINRFFLEQEAKIKADKIMGLKTKNLLRKK